MLGSPIWDMIRSISQRDSCIIDFNTLLSVFFQCIIQYYHLLVFWYFPKHLWSMNQLHHQRHVTHIDESVTSPTSRHPYRWISYMTNVNESHLIRVLRMFFINSYSCTNELRVVDVRDVASCDVRDMASWYIYVYIYWPTKSGIVWCAWHVRRRKSQISRWFAWGGIVLRPTSRY